MKKCQNVGHTADKTNPFGILSILIWPAKCFYNMVLNQTILDFSVVERVCLNTYLLEFWTTLEHLNPESKPNQNITSILALWAEYWSCEENGECNFLTARKSNLGSLARVLLTICNPPFDQDYSGWS